MYEGYEKLYQVDTNAMDPTQTASFDILPVEAFAPARSYSFGMSPNVLMPLEYTGWRDETLAWHLTSSLGATLNPSPVTIIRGPQAIDFMRENFVNNIDNFPIGASKHGLMLLEDGTIAAQGVIMRTDEQEYEAYWLSPFIDYRFSQKEWDAELIDVTNERFLFQMQGPKCLAILEEATGEDLHDIGFCRSRKSSIDGMEVTILRFGMGNTLGYEVHGNAAEGPAIHKRLMEVGTPYGIRRMGFLAYEMNHTTGGSQQGGTHFDLSPFADPGYVAFCNGGVDVEVSSDYVEGFLIEGSFDGDPSERYANPIEIGLRRVINWNHDFVGKEALLKYRENPRRNLKTLVWNVEDIVDVFRSQFSDDPYRQMDDWAYEVGHFGMPKTVYDRVLDMDGNKIGFSGGRMMDWWNKAMISMAIMDVDYCEDGTQVQVVWGEPGTHQKLIRATVAPVPYNTHLENRSTDVKSL